jgi:tRNA-splicing ligase RtcB
MYKFKKNKMNVPAYVWSTKGNIEEQALEQLEIISSLPFVFHHTVLCPDGHTGYGMPIGGVIATKGVVIPNAVGVDIGCGMCAVQTDIKELKKEALIEILKIIREKIPVGFEHQKEKQENELFDKAPDIKVIQEELERAKYQIGTLGGGNHFIEIQKDQDGYVWIMIHSGSRNFGYKIAKEYNKKAQELNKKWYSNIPVFKGEDGLAFLPIDTEEGKEYIQAMNYALGFAFQNRLYMIEECKKAFKENIDCNFEEVINIHHNYASIENHFGSNVWVHRKGATSAYEGQIGIIPGSQGTCSYIVEGKGNPESFKSCSHGAGRKMGRKQAQRELSIENETKILNDKGILHSIRNKSDLDEAPSAYKDIDVVMEEQKDLVDIKYKLEPLAVIKG